jgi:hypothetical protein
MGLIARWDSDFDSLLPKKKKTDPINKIIKLANNRPDYIRYGQAIFNEAYILYPNEADQLRGTEFDCFYRTDKIPMFLEKLKELING